jgi:uncharacterized protein with HEPN domain
MNRDRIWLRFMLERMEHLDECAAVGREVFLSDRLVQDAAVRNLQVLADVSERLPEDLLEQQPGAAWHALRALRNLLVHEPLNVDPVWLWECLEYDRPVLRQALEALKL